MPKLIIAPSLPTIIQEASSLALEGFSPLHDYKIFINATNLKGVTMRAQPVLNRRFFRKKHRCYKIDVQPQPAFGGDFNLGNLPKEVLIGWLAHEFGHLIDYLDRTWYGLVKMGIAYSLLPIYRAGVERRADLFAIKYGYATQIQRTKRFLLNESNIPNRYLNRINKYYMSLEEIDEILLNQERKLPGADTIL